MTSKQKEDVAKAFATSNGEIQFDQKLKALGLDSPKYEDEIADIVYAIATTQINIKLP